jgi:hypothetical protein
MSSESAAVTTSFGVESLDMGDFNAAAARGCSRAS